MREGSQKYCQGTFEYLWSPSKKENGSPLSQQET